MKLIVTGSQVLGYVGLLYAGTEWVVDCGTQDKGSKWIVFSLESYSLAGLLDVYIHIMSPGYSLLNGLICLICLLRLICPDRSSRSVRASRAPRNKIYPICVTA